jgi:hypothetical protein
METEELRKRIKEAVAVIESYRGFGPMVDDGIDALNRIDACVAEPTPERVAEAKSLLEGLNREIGPYRSYVPTVALALQELNEWMKTV